jgi:hypothetical protein
MNNDGFIESYRKYQFSMLWRTKQIGQKSLFGATNTIRQAYSTYKRKYLKDKVIELATDDNKNIRHILVHGGIHKYKKGIQPGANLVKG